MQILDLDIIGTHLTISIDTPHTCDEVFSDIRVRLEDFELRYSRFISNNWLDMLNKNRTGVLDIDGKKMLEYMIKVAWQTDGYFDPTVGKQLTELGYGKKNDDIFRESRFGNYRDIEIIGDLVLLHWDIFLEFWGIGKGYLIDVIQNFLKVYPKFLINFWGDMYGRGEWTIWLESPFASDEVIGTIVLVDHFLACSAGTRRAWWIYHHLIDPHTGESANAVVASYIEWASGMIVDIHATALCVMPWELAIATLEKIPDISWVIVSAEGNIYQKEESRADIFV